MHWKQTYGKADKGTVVACTVCGTSTTKYSSTKRNHACSRMCVFYLRWNRWPTSEVPRTHPSRVVLEDPDEILQPWHNKIYRIYIPDCRWCGRAFVTQQPAQMLCSKRCRNRVDRARRKALEHGAPGTYTWTEVIGLFLAFGRCCAYCRQPIEGQPDPDHVVPLSRGGSNSITNILPACRACNCDKRDLSLDDWSADRARRGLSAVQTTWVRGDPRFQHLMIVQHHEYAA